VGSGGRLATGGNSDDGGTATTGGRPGAGGMSESGGGLGRGGVVATGGVSASSGGMTNLTGGDAGIGTGGAGQDAGSAGAGGAMGSGGNTGTGGGQVATGGSSSAVFPARFVGNTDAWNVVPTDFASYWEQITPENVGKWASIQASSEGNFNWSALDAVYKYAEDNNLIFKEHCFIWGAAQPAWLGRLDTTTAPVVVKAWMKTFCDRYPKTRLIDVVNEPPPHTTPAYSEAMGGGTRTTWDWVANAFKWARESCPNAILILNDYNNIEYDREVENTIAIVNAIQKLDAPIDAIGCQAHEGARVPASTFRANIDKLVDATGLPIYITGFDIGLADDGEQEQKYAEFFPMFWDHPAIKGVTLWGYIDGRTWRSNTGLIRTDGTPRAAMTWLMTFLGR